MLAYVKSEMLKQKHSFNKVLLWFAPLLTTVLTFALMGASYLQDGAYNWWYTLILPGCFTLFSAFTITKELRKNRHGLLGIAIQKRKLWLAQILICTFFLFAACMFFFVFITIGGIVTLQKYTILESFIASILLFVTFAWQIPLWMFMTEKTGAFLTITFSLVCNFMIAVICATKYFWWIPFAIPARLMCVCIHVLPNGLTVETGNYLTDKSVLLPGIFITIFLYVLLTGLTSVWFEKREV